MRILDERLENYLHDLRPAPEGSAEAITSARALNPELLDSHRWLGSVLPIGDGVGFAARL